LTSSGEEAVSQVFESIYLEECRREGRNHIVTSVAEETASVDALERLQELGCTITRVVPDVDGIVRPEVVKKALTPRTALVSFSWVNALTGVIQPAEEIGVVCKEAGVWYHLDASYAFGRLFVEFPAQKADYVTFDGPAFHSPAGIGALVARRGVPLRHLIAGSGQGVLRGGVLNVPGAASLAAAAHEMLGYRDLLTSEIARLRYKLESSLCHELPGTQVMGVDAERISSCTTLAFPGIHAESLLFALSRKRLYACLGGGKFQNLSSVLLHQGHGVRVAQSALSFALSRDTTEEEIDEAIECITVEVKKLQKQSMLFFE
jgi:cysteine desulfurase